MIFREAKENNGWVTVEYGSTWQYDYDFMLDAAQAVIDMDFQENLQRFAIAENQGDESIEKIEEVRMANKVLRDCDFLNKEYAVSIVSGFSKIMGCPIQLIFFNKTNSVRLMSPANEYFKERGEHVFDNYLNSLEIKAYCNATERETIEKMRKE